MNKTLSLFGWCILIFILMHACSAKADTSQPVDIFKCAKLAGAYSKNPFALSMGDLDALRGCISWQMEATVREAQDRKIDRAIEKNFAAPRDGE